MEWNSAPRNETGKDPSVTGYCTKGRAEVGSATIDLSSNVQLSISLFHSFPEAAQWSVWIDPGLGGAGCVPMLVGMHRIYWAPQGLGGAHIMGNGSGGSKRAASSFCYILIKCSIIKTSGEKMMELTECSWHSEKEFEYWRKPCLLNSSCIQIHILC